MPNLNKDAKGVAHGVKMAEEKASIDKGTVAKYASGAIAGAVICGAVVYGATKNKDAAMWGAIGGALAMTLGMPIAEYLDSAIMGM